MRKVAIFCLLLIVVPLVSFASGLEANWPRSPLGTEITSDTQIHELIAYIYEWGISLGGVAVFAIIIIAGLEYISSAGDPAKMRAALARIQNGILGVVLLLTSWLILNTINPQLTTVRSLPNLWGVGEYSLGSLDLSGAEGMSCDYIVVWDAPNYSGGSTVIRFEEGQETINLPSLQAIMNSWANLAGPITGWLGGAIGGWADGAREAAWQSVKGYRKISDQEKVALAEGGMSMDLYDDSGQLLNQAEGFDYERDDLYTYGGVCQIKLYYSSSSWWQPNEPCGNLLGTGTTPAIPNVTDLKFYNKKVECIEISRELPGQQQQQVSEEN